MRYGGGRWPRVLVLAAVAVAVAGCERMPSAVPPPPPVPVAFTVDAAGGVAVEPAHKQYVTYVGTFPVGDDVHHRPVAAEQAGRTPGQFVTLVIRHGPDGTERDDLYEVSAGRHAVIDIDKHVRYAVTERRVFVNAAAGAVGTIEVDSTGRGPDPSVPGGPPLPGHTPVGTITVPGEATTGVEFTAGRTGRYQFTYESGSYSTYPTNENRVGLRTWLTTVLVFRSGTPLFDGTRIRKEVALARLGDTKYWVTQKEAVDAATGQHVELDLAAGDKLTLAAVDRYGHYPANPGGVVVTCEYLETGEHRDTAAVP